MKYLLLILMLSGCAALTDEATPREYNCNAICEGCTRCEVDCDVVGQGTSTRDIKIGEGR